MKLEISRANFEDIEKLDQLNPVGLKNWESEFFDSRMPNSFVYVATQEGQFTGVEGYIGYKLCSRGEIIQSHRSERTLLLPSMRGKGVFENLVASCHNESIIHNSICCWGATSALKPFKKAGFIPFEKWRRYYFIPVVGFKWRHLSDLWKEFMVFKRNKSIDNFINLGSTLSCFLPTINFGAKQFKVNKISCEEYAEIYNQSLGIDTEDNDDYRLFIDINFLEWVQQRGINLEFLKISSLNHSSYICYKSNGDKIIVLDFVLSPYMEFKQIIHSLKNFFKLSSSFKSIIFSLNLKNPYSFRLSKKLPKIKISSPLVGSFVIHPGIKEIGIHQLRITPLWLEL